MKLKWETPREKFILALVLSSLVSEGLFAYNAIHNHSLEFDYLSWNLLLAWAPLIFAARLNSVLHRKLWSSWEALMLSIVWLLFLPNSFYMITDFIHLQNTSPANGVYDALVLSSFIYTGVALGFSSLFLIHLHLRRRLSSRSTWIIVNAILFICCVATYFGRDLRWNSWDVFTNPGGLLFDISERALHLASYPGMIEAIIGFFVLLITMYHLLWRAVHLIPLKHS